MVHLREVSGKCKYMKMISFVLLCCSEKQLQNIISIGILSALSQPLNGKMICVPNEDTDQPEYLPSLLCLPEECLGGP